ncbi:MAG: CehA/McbA family metallohydrolase, partial [Pirellulaceae bacterium]
QGAVVGTAHSGFGLHVSTDELPNYEVPPFDGIGANEYIVDVTHEVPGPDGQMVPAIDFLAMVDTPHVWELNIWYHTLNCGFRTRISGETDFPCIYGERVGLGRSYVRLDDELTFDKWCEGIRAGRSYVSDGRSHLMEFAVNGVEAGTESSEVHLSGPAHVTVTAQVAARLSEEPLPGFANLHYAQRPYWHVERSRVPGTRRVPVELIVNGEAVARQEIEADGSLQNVEFETAIDESSWVALRILPSSHTNPLFVIMDEQPIRASRRSAEWCLAGVRQCKTQKQRFIKDEELEDFEVAYAHAETTWQRLIEESAER